MSLHHYSVERSTPRQLLFWSGRLSDAQLDANRSEVNTRADVLIDGLEMLVPNLTDAQQRLIREAVMHVKKSQMLILGAFVLQEQQP